MRFGQFIEYTIGKNFLGKAYTENVGETSPRPFPEKLKLSILDQ